MGQHRARSGTEREEPVLPVGSTPMKALLIAVFAACGATPQTSSPAAPTTSPHATQAAIQPDAAALVDAWSSALGSRDAQDVLGALHAKGSYEKGGVVGTIEVW